MQEKKENEQKILSKQELLQEMDDLSADESDLEFGKN